MTWAWISAGAGPLRRWGAENIWQLFPCHRATEGVLIFLFFFLILIKYNIFSTLLQTYEPNLRNWHDWLHVFLMRLSCSQHLKKAPFPVKSCEGVTPPSPPIPPAPTTVLFLKSAPGDRKLTTPKTAHYFPRTLELLEKSFLSLAQTWLLGVPTPGASSAVEPRGTMMLLFTPEYPSEVWRQRLGTPNPLPNTSWPPFRLSDRHPVTQTPPVFKKPPWRWGSGTGTPLQVRSARTSFWAPTPAVTADTAVAFVIWLVPGLGIIHMIAELCHPPLSLCASVLGILG